MLLQKRHSNYLQFNSVLQFQRFPNGLNKTSERAGWSAGTVPRQPLRTCLVVVWLMVNGRAAGTKGDIWGRKIDELGDKREEGISGFLDANHSCLPDSCSVKSSCRQTGRASWVRQQELEAVVGLGIGFDSRKQAGCCWQGPIWR